MVKGCFAAVDPAKKVNTQKRNVQVNDYVIVSKPNVMIGKWNAGKVVRVYHGDDGLVRNVKVKTATGSYSEPVNCYKHNSTRELIM